MDTKQIMVIGAGQMGSGIAQTCAKAGYHVTLYDNYPAALEKGINGIDSQLTKSVVKERITEEEKLSILSRIEISDKLQSAKTADIVIEAVVEDSAVKTGLFRDLDVIAPEHAILATNTSSISITEIAAATKRPGQVIGMHFMNPVPVMKLVEVIRGLQTSDQTYEKVAALAQKLGKTTVEVQDYPGFVSNRILMPMINEAIYAVYEGAASVEDVDNVMKLGMNHPMGPLELADFIGLDTCLSIMEVLHEGFSDSKYRPCPLLKNHVHAGWVGKKAGRGFYTYTE